MRLNYSHNYVLVASAMKQRQSYNRNNVNPSKWMLIVVKCCHWWAITHSLTSVKWVTWNTQTDWHTIFPYLPLIQTFTNHFCPKQITVKGSRFIFSGVDVWRSATVRPLARWQTLTWQTRFDLSHVSMQWRANRRRVFFRPQEQARLRWRLLFSFKMFSLAVLPRLHASGADVQWLQFTLRWRATV